MRLSAIIITSILFLGTGCISTPTSPKVLADEVNPTIEQRIAARVAEGRASGAPDLRDTPSETPTATPAATLAASRTSVLQKAATLQKDIADTRQDMTNDAAEQRRLRLLAQVARDRQAARADRALRPTGEPAGE